MKLSRRLSSRRQNKQSLRTAFKVSTLLTLVSVSAAHATTYVYEGTGTTAAPVNGSFSGSNFSPSLGTTLSAPASLDTDTLSFGGTTTYTATDDFTAAVLAETLSFSNTGTIILAKSTTTGTTNSITLGTGSVGTISLTNTGTISEGLNLVLSGAATVTGTGGMTITGVVSGGYAFASNTTGALTLAGVNTYTGATSFGLGSTLTLTGTTSASSALVSNGGTFNDSSTTATSQSFNGLSVATGASVINNTVAGNTLNLGNITHTTGGVVGFGTTTGTITTTVNNTNGIIGTWATIGTGANTQYAVGSTSPSSMTITGLTGTGAATAANLSDTTGTANYDLAAGGTAPAKFSANTIRYTGATGTITTGAGGFTLNGLLNIGGGTLTIAGNPVTIGANNELVINTASGNVAISSSIGGAAGSALTLVGSGTVTLSGANTYTGTTYLNGGTLALAAANSLPATTQVVFSPATATVLNLGAFNQSIGSISAATAVSGSSLMLTGQLTVGSDNLSTTFADVISGTGGSLVKNGDGTLVLSGANTYTGSTTLNAGIVNASNATAFGTGKIIFGGGTLQYGSVTTDFSSLVASGAASNGANVITIDTNGKNVGFGTAIPAAQTAGLTKLGAGTLTLSATEGFTGGLMVNTGTLLLTGSLPAGDALNVGSGTFSYSKSGTNTQTVNGLTVNGGNSVVNNTVATDTLNLGTITRTGAGGVNFSTNTGVITTTTGNSNGIIGPWATYGIGANTVYAVGAATAGTATTITGLTGTNANAANNLTDTSGTANYSLQAGGTVSANFSGNTINYMGGTDMVTLGGGTFALNGLLNTGGGTLTIAGNAISAGSTGELVINMPNGSVNISSAITGNGGLTMLGTSTAALSTLTLSGANTYSGATTLNGGILSLGASGTLSPNSQVVFGGTSTAVLNLGTTAQVVASISAPTYVGGAEIVGNSSAASSLTEGADNTNTTFNATVSHTTIIKNGSGTLTLGGTGDNSSTALTVNAGEVILNKVSSAGAHDVGSALTINGGTVQLAGGTLAGAGTGYEIYVTAPVTVNGGGTLDLNGQSDSVGSLASASTGGTVTNTSTAASTLTVGTTTTAAAYSGNITDNGANGGTLALVKIGTGVQTFSGTNTYSGGTTVSAGVLEIAANASLPNSGAGTTVASGATLAVAVGGTSALGVSNGNALLNTATFAAGSMLGFDTTGGNTTDGTSYSGTYGLNKLGINTLTLTGASTYTGPTAITAGTLAASGAVGALPTASTVNLAGVLAGATPVTLSIQNDAPGTINQGNNIAITSTSNSAFSGPTIDVRNNGGATTGSVVAFGALSDGPAGSEYKTEINFTGANGYTESFTSLALPAVGTSTFLLNPTTTSVSIGNVTGTVTSGSDTLNLGGTSKNNAITGTIADGSAGTTTVAVENTATWTLGGANTYTGATIFAAGGTMILTGSIGTAAAPGTTASVLTGQSGSFIYAPSAGSGTVQSFGSYNASLASSSLSNTVAGSTLNIGAISRSNSADLDFAQTTGAITTTTANVNSILGPYATFGAGAGTQYAVGAATAGAATAVTGFTGTSATAAGLNSVTTNYELTAGGTAPAAGSAYTIRYSGGTDALTSTTSLTASGIMNVGGGTLTINGGTVIPGATAVGGTARELNVSTPNGSVVINSNITNNGSMASSFTAAGPGTVTLTGANSYTYYTFVEGGALVLNTSASGTGNTTVYQEGTLLGAGIAPSGTTAIMANGTLAPGAAVAANGVSAAAPGMLTLGALTLTGVGNGTLGSNVNILLKENGSATGAGAGTAYSQIATTGATTLNGNLSLTLGSALTVGDKFFILLNNSATVATNGTFANIGASGTVFASGGDTFTINYADNGDGGTVANDVSVTVDSVAAVPEPGTWAAVLAGIGLYGFARRRSARARVHSVTQS